MPVRFLPPFFYLPFLLSSLILRERGFFLFSATFCFDEDDDDDDVDVDDDVWYGIVTGIWSRVWSLVLVYVSMYLCNVFFCFFVLDTWLASRQQAASSCIAMAFSFSFSFRFVVDLYIFTSIYLFFLISSSHPPTPSLLFPSLHIIFRKSTSSNSR